MINSVAVVYVAGCSKIEINVDSCQFMINLHGPVEILLQPVILLFGISNRHIVLGHSRLNLSGCGLTCRVQSVVSVLTIIHCHLSPGFLHYDPT